MDKKYDFSGISTEKLRSCKNSGRGCRYIHCDFDSCPLKPDCGRVESEVVHSILMNELKRREEKENMNEMPELKAGMIVKGNMEEWFIVMPETGHRDGIMFCNTSGNGSSTIELEEITCIAILNKHYNYGPFFNNSINSNKIDILWEKDNHIKKLRETIREAQEIIAKASKQLEEIENEK